MTTADYLVGTVRHRFAETLSSVVALGLVVAFLSSLGSFVATTSHDLTARAAAGVPVDWQLQVTPGTAVQRARAALSDVPGIVGVREVTYARTSGLESISAGGTRRTGAAVVVGLPDDYARFAPGELRTLTGATTGVLLQQQTASNLGASVGSRISVAGAGSAVVAGVVDVPFADQFFQVVGAPATAGASSPPDNVVFVPDKALPMLVGTAPQVHQLHVRFDRASLPRDPAQAADEMTRRANHVIATLAGGALVGDDLGAALSAAREDAVYARLLVLLLGIPGVALACVVAGMVLSLRLDRQRRDLALLRLRGATPLRSGMLLGAPALIDGVVAAGLGCGIAALSQDVQPSWAVAGSVTAIVLSLGVALAPNLRLLRRGATSIADRTAGSPSERLPLPLRLGLDVALLAGSGLVFWLTSRGGYKVVVVPEGVPVASVNYGALLAPALAWPGVALLTWRVIAAALSRHPRRPERDDRGRVPDLRNEVLRRRRRLIARGATGLAVAIAVALSTAVFTRTYDQQARVDVALTVGADVAVKLPPDDPRGLAVDVARVPGAQAVEQMSHRLAYVGPDLQDLFAVDAATIGRAAPLQDAFTPGSSVRTQLRRLSATPDGALLSQETLHDYQLQTGDLVRLRLKDQTGQYRVVPFHVVGVVTEFATAPRDSFVVANRSYVAQQTGRDAVQTLLVKTTTPARVAHRIHPPYGAIVDSSSAPVLAVTSASGLAAGSLSGLARLTLVFALLLAAASSALVLVVGAVQRQRSITALAVVGATPRQRAAFLWTEARAVLLGGTVAGCVAGALIAWQLVKVLTGIFDPPPERPAVPGSFIAVLLGTVLLGGGLAAVLCARLLGRVDASRLREF